jgi:hypothetical protein
MKFAHRKQAAKRVVTIIGEDEARRLEAVAARYGWTVAQAGREAIAVLLERHERRDEVAA